MVGVWASGWPLAIMLTVTSCLLTLALSMLKMFAHRKGEALNCSNSHKSRLLFFPLFSARFEAALTSFLVFSSDSASPSTRKTLLVNSERCSQSADHTCCLLIGWELINYPPPDWLRAHHLSASFNQSVQYKSLIQIIYFMNTHTDNWSNLEFLTMSWVSTCILLLTLVTLVISRESQVFCLIFLSP